jgi:hypothetical protein
MAIRNRAAAFAGFCFSLGAAVLPGDAVPDLKVKDASGVPVRLSAYRGMKYVVLVAIPPGRSTPAVETDTIRRLAAMDTVLLFSEGPAATLLVDRDGVARRVAEGRVLAGRELERFVYLWRSGKDYFVAYCARCHDEDGTSTLCVPTPLTGVGRRLTEEKLRESLRIGEVNAEQVVIRGEMIRRVQLDAILVYVSGL